MYLLEKNLSLFWAAKVETETSTVTCVSGRRKETCCSNRRNFWESFPRVVTQGVCKSPRKSTEWRFSSYWGFSIHHSIFSYFKEIRIHLRNKYKQYEGRVSSIISASRNSHINILQVHLYQWFCQTSSVKDQLVNIYRHMISNETSAPAIVKHKSSDRQRGNEWA